MIAPSSNRARTAPENKLLPKRNGQYETNDTSWTSTANGTSTGTWKARMIVKTSAAKK